MRFMRAALVAGIVTVSTSCESFLDVNTNPNGPQDVSANLYLPPMLHWMVTSQPFDGRFIGRYVQNFTNVATTLSTWDRMGYDPGSDNAGEVWRTVYWVHGQNLVDMNTKAEAEERWDILGVGMLIKGWGWMTLASLHGDVIVADAFNQGSSFTFDYDTEQVALDEARKMLDSAVVLLQRTDGAVDATYLGKTDRIYNGDRTKWLKLAYGLRAMLRNRYSNKASYDPAGVISDVDNSFVSNADDALLAYPATQPSDDRNFWGPARNNMAAFRQTQFALNLMNGTVFGTDDPRRTRMLAPSPDGAYRGYDINTVNKTTAFTATTAPNNFWGYTTAQAANTPSRYLFSDKSKYPIATYSQLQFVKAEAAFRMGNRALALTAYTNGISSHIDFVNARNSDDGQTPTQISAAEKAAFLASPTVVPAAAALTMTQIMSQKYIAQWMWGFFEQWMDMRRFKYTGTYTGEAQQVFPGFAPPTSLYPDNSSKLAYRLRPRFNSEYVWNLAGLSKITPIPGTNTDYQTSELWIINP